MRDKGYFDVEIEFNEYVKSIEKKLEDPSYKGIRLKLKKIYYAGFAKIMFKVKNSTSNLTDVSTNYLFQAYLKKIEKEILNLSEEEINIHAVLFTDITDSIGCFVKTKLFALIDDELIFEESNKLIYQVEMFFADQV